MAEQSFERDVDPQQQIRQLLGVIRRGWLPILTCLGVGVLIGVALWSFLPKSYVSTAKVMMRSNWMFEGRDDTKALDDLPFIARARQLEDELRSTEWVKAVLDRLEWPDWSRAKNSDLVEERRYVQKVKDQISCRVQPGETGERLVLVSFSWHDRQAASDFCKTLKEYWLNTSIEDYSGEVDRRVAIHEESLRLKQDDLEESRRVLEQFETSHGISAINQRQDSQQRADVLGVELDRLSGEIAGLEAMVEQKDRDLAATNADGTLAIPPTMPESSTITNDTKAVLLQQIISVLAQIDSLKARSYTEKYPPLQQLHNELKVLIVSAAEQPNTVEVANPQLPNPVFELRKKERDDVYTLLQSRRAQQVKSESDRARILATLSTLPQVLRQHNSLQADVAINTELVFLQKQALQPLKDKKLALARTGAGVLLPYKDLELPVPAPSPSSAIGWLALAVSTLLGFALALAVVIGKEFLRSSFSSADQARRTLKLPVLGEVAPIQTAIEVRRARFIRSLQIAASLTLLLGISAAIYVCVVHPKDLPHGLVDWAMDLREALS